MKMLRPKDNKIVNAWQLRPNRTLPDWVTVAGPHLYMVSLAEGAQRRVGQNAWVVEFPEEGVREVWDSKNFAAVFEPVVEGETMTPDQKELTTTKKKSGVKGRAAINRIQS